MPRTPLLAALLQLARDHANAETEGITPEQVRVDRQTRRHFLGTVAAGIGGAALLGQTAEAAPASPQLPKIAIVGGGISGLACALQLADKGLASTVYESKGRVGGRMFSDMSGTY